MPFFILAVALGLAAATVPPSSAQDAAPPEAVAVEDDAPTVDLSTFLWVARPLVIFADTPNDPRFLEQLQLLEERAADLAERRVVVLTDADPAANGPLRRELRPRDFGLVLIDTDGSVVQRRPAPTSARELTRMIDRLPSRRREIGSSRP